MIKQMIITVSERHSQIPHPPQMSECCNNPEQEQEMGVESPCEAPDSHSCRALPCPDGELSTAALPAVL